MANRVVIEVTRGTLVESVHCGAVAVARSSGELLFEHGDVARPVYPRSAVKPLQCLPLIETGAADRFGFGDREVALACASHGGTAQHTELALSMLTRAGLTVDALGCGAHAPSDFAADCRLIREGARPTALHNNCSGKHAGMLATAIHCGDPPVGYWLLDHPVQVRVGRTLEGLIGRPLGSDVVGIDGCSLPNWAIPLAELARAFACFVTGEGAGAAHRAAAKRIAAACWAAPELVAGNGRLDTAVMRALPGKVLMKTGAEGVYCAALPELGLGIALKIDDGAKRAAEALIMGVIAHLLPAAHPLTPDPVLRNWRGTVVGEVRLASAFRSSLDRCAV